MLVLALAGCLHQAPVASHQAPFSWLPDEAARLEAERFEVVTRGSPDAAVLRVRARELPPGVDLTRLADAPPPGSHEM